MWRSISCENTNLAVVDLPQGAAVLPDNPNRLVTFFRKRSFIEDQSSFRVPHVFVNHLVVFCEDQLLIPNYVTYKTLQGSHICSFDVKGHRLNRFSFKPTKLAGHIPEEVFPRFASRKAVRKIVMKSS